MPGVIPGHPRFQAVDGRNMPGHDKIRRRTRIMLLKRLIAVLTSVIALASAGAAQERRLPTQNELRLSSAPVVHHVAPPVVNVYAAKPVQNPNPLLDDPIFRRFFGVPGGGGGQLHAWPGA